MNAAKAIAFVDSGLGGIPYISHFRSLVPGAYCVYVADNLNFPYGNKSEDEITAGVVAMVGRVLDRYDPELIVVACNTASTVALAALRQRFSVEFVGVVPAIKPAASLSKSKVVGILATERTINGAYLDRLIESHANGCRIVRQAATELISRIEADPFMEDRGAYTRLLEDTLETFKRAGADVIVLGCTHFLLLDEEFQRVYGKGFTILDSREGVSKQAMRLLDNHGSLAARKTGSLDQGSTLHLTREIPDPRVYEKMAYTQSMRFGGVL